MMRSIDRKITHEDKFARRWYCNAWRFVRKMKRYNRRKARRLWGETYGEF